MIFSYDFLMISAILINELTYFLILKKKNINIKFEDFSKSSLNFPMKCIKLIYFIQNRENFFLLTPNF